MSINYCFVQALVSLKRIRIFLCGTDLDPRNVHYTMEGGKL